MSQKEMEIRMEDRLGVDAIDIAGEKYEGVDPAIFDDPILMLQWLEGKPQQYCGLPAQQAPNSIKPAEKKCSKTVANNAKGYKDTQFTLDESWIVEDIMAAEDVDIVEGFDRWLSEKVTADSKRELYEAYEVIEGCAYKYKVLEKDLLSTTNIATVRKVQNLLIQKREFRSMDATKRYICGLALRYYIQYLTESKKP